jgi:hypothetical protein
MSHGPLVTWGDTSVVLQPSDKFLGSRHPLARIRRSRAVLDDEERLADDSARTNYLCVEWILFDSYIVNYRARPLRGSVAEVGTITLIVPVPVPFSSHGPFCLKLPSKESFYCIALLCVAQALEKKPTRRLFEARLLTNERCRGTLARATCLLARPTPTICVH